MKEYNENYPKDDFDDGKEWKKEYQEHLKNNEELMGDNHPMFNLNKNGNLVIKCPACKKKIKVLHLTNENPNYCSCCHCSFRFIIPEGMLGNKFGKELTYDDMIDLHETLKTVRVDKEGFVRNNKHIEM